NPWLGMQTLILPSLALGTAVAAFIMRMVRSSLLDVLRQDFIRTANAKGLGDNVVLYRHALKNAFIPVLTIIGVQVGYLLGGAATVLACIALSVLAPFVAPYGPEETHPNSKLFAPNQYFVFGTDEFGRDILSRIVFGARISLEVGLISVSLALVLGASAGLLAGFLGGWLDGLTMRCMDVLFAFPAILLAIGIMAVLGTGIANAMLAIGIVYAPSFARLARASVLSLKEMEFVQAARVLGLGELAILVRHVVPNVLGPMIVQTSFSLSTAIPT